MLRSELRGRYCEGGVLRLMLRSELRGIDAAIDCEGDSAGGGSNVSFKFLGRSLT